MVLRSVEQDLMFSGGCNYLRYRTYYELEIHYVNVSDTYKHYIENITMFH